MTMQFLPKVPSFKCMVPGCKSGSKVHRHLRFFSLPRNLKLLEIWARNMNILYVLDKPRTTLRHYRICGKHFEDICFQTPAKIKLNRKMVPTILTVEPEAMCRACMTKNGDFQSVFMFLESTGLNIYLSEMVMAYSSLQIIQGDGLPEEICSECAKKVSEFYLFKLKCEETEKNLRSIFAKSLYNIMNDQTTDIIIKSEIDADDFEVTPNQITNEKVESDDFIKNEDNDFVDKQKTEIIFECDICNTCFPRNDILINHKKLHKCKVNQSKEGFQNNEIIKYHHQILKSKFDSKCYETEESSTGHLAVQKSDDLTCKDCKKEFLRIIRNENMVVPAAVKPYNFNLYNEGFGRVKQLSQHVDDSRINPHVCNTCSKVMEEKILPDMCRACMTENGDFQSVFVFVESTGLNINLAEMVMAYSTVQIMHGDGLPEQICTECAKKISEFYLFKLKCEETDKNLRSIFAKSPYNVMSDQTTDVIIKSEIDAENFKVTPYLMTNEKMESDDFIENENNEFVDILPKTEIIEIEEKINVSQEMIF